MDYQRPKKRIYITWDRYSSRSDSTAKFFDAKSYSIEAIKSPAILLVPLKYFLATVKTLTVLSRERPDVVFVQNPPTVAVLVVWLYCRIFGSEFIPDTHSGIFTGKRWSVFLGLNRFLGKRALANIAHNDYFVCKIRQWGAKAVNLGSVPRQMKTDKSYHIRKGFSVVFPCSFYPDEPIEEVINAAKLLRDVNFYITGNLKRASTELFKTTPDNVVFTDFLPHEDYVALLKACNVVMCLTTQDFTNQSGAYEAIAVGRPIIVSNWPLLRDLYYRGVIHVDNTHASIIRAINEIRGNYSYFLDQIQILKEEGLALWAKNYAELQNLLNKAEA